MTMIQVIDLHFQNYPQTIASFLIESDEGPIILETGPHSTLPMLEKGLRQRGYQLEDVKHVFLTHIHLDHAGAAWAFAKHGAMVYVHPTGAPHLHNPEKLFKSAKRIYGDKMDELWGDLKPIPTKNITVVAHNQVKRVGKVKLKSLHTPGHAVHHIAWQYSDALIAGDVAGIRIKNGIVVPPCPPPDINLEDWRASIRLIKMKRFREIYLTHFGKVTKVKAHLVELEGRLVNWANWIKPWFENQTPMEEITPEFQRYVSKQLESADIRNETLVQYENANPAWMSVAGLMRYWQKKEG
jgi:glyoxylase-like metal-dependent hydrolase (beta-lactamase superfamily II)